MGGASDPTPELTEKLHFYPSEHVATAYLLYARLRPVHRSLHQHSCTRVVTGQSGRACFVPIHLACVLSWGTKVAMPAPWRAKNSVNENLNSTLIDIVAKEKFAASRTRPFAIHAVVLQLDIRPDQRTRAGHGDVDAVHSVRCQFVQQKVMPSRSACAE